MTYLLLFWEFFKTGLFAIGGWLSTLPFLFDMSSKTGWFTTQELANMIAVSESTPGPIGINMSTYVGYKVGGLAGAFCSTFGLVFPSLIVIGIVYYLLKKFAQEPVVKLTFSNLRAMVIGLIGFAFYELAYTVFLPFSTVSIISILFFVLCLFVNLKVKKLHPLYFILAGALFGLVLPL